MKLKHLNILFSVVILLSNIYFICTTIKLIEKDGGPMGLGYFVLPFSLIINLGIIPSLIVILGKRYNNKLLLFLNSVNSILILFLLYISL